MTPYLTFSGDTDMVTAGLASLSSIILDEIVVAEMNSQEWNDVRSDDAFQGRINSLLDRNDLRSVRLRRAEAAAPASGLSFQDFLQNYAPPRLVFACPQCGLDAVTVRSATPFDYKVAGGTLTVVGNLEFRDLPAE